MFLFGIVSQSFSFFVGVQAAEIAFGGVGLFSPVNFDLGKVGAQLLLFFENLHEQHSYGFIPCLMPTLCLKNLPTGRVSPHLSSGTCLVFWLFWKAICLLNKASAVLESVRRGLRAMRPFQTFLSSLLALYMAHTTENVPLLLYAFFVPHLGVRIQGL